MQSIESQIIETDSILFTSNIISLSVHTLGMSLIDVISSQYIEFMIKLDDKDKNLLQESLRSVRSLPFVEKIEFEETGPTILVRLSEMNIETEEKIYQIEYNLLKNFKDYIDFIVFPIEKVRGPNVK